MPEITYKTELDNINWVEMKTTLCQDAFDNGRSPGQLKKSFENSYVACIAYAGSQIIGTARVLSDGVSMLVLLMFGHSAHIVVRVLQQQ
ncbi:hypothetical protein [Oscillatoria sp. FACHB-1407]|uniref:hypothetical protein n=1 Tax=Oscillatoria sp. FACHB-1407 TaxID=2692847 RepID=UPI0018EF49CD|nr:hypothetical protein [Oscillatoria sp. FACHB-1407]